MRVARAPTELHRQQRSQHAAAVHRKGGDEIEDGEKQVGVGEAGDERHARVVEPRQIGGVERADQQQQDDGDDEIDRRPGDGDGEFLRRLVRHRLQAGDAADRQQRDFRRLNAVAARDENVAELVQHDADEQEDDEDEAVARRRRAALLPGAEADPGEQQQEGDVNLHRRAAEAANRQGPAHRRRLARWRRGSRRSLAPTLRGGPGIIAHRLKPRRLNPRSVKNAPEWRWHLRPRPGGSRRRTALTAPKRRRRGETDEIVGLVLQTRQRFARGDRNGERQRLRAAAADRLQRGARCRAGGDAVVDEDRGAAGDRRARPFADEAAAARLRARRARVASPPRTRARRSRRR